MSENPLVLALTRLLECPAMTEDAKEGEDLAAIEDGELALATYRSLQDDCMNFLKALLEDWPEFTDPDTEVNGGDLVEYLGERWPTLIELVGRAQS